MDHACTVATLVAAGLALMATSATRLVAEELSRALASYIISAVRGHRVLQRESIKARTTSRPRREESVTGRPNWSIRLKSGAGSPAIGKPPMAVSAGCVVVWWRSVVRN